MQAPTRQSARLKQKDERSKARLASFRKLRSGSSSGDEDAGCSEDSEPSAAYFPTPTKLDKPANNFTKVYNSYCRDADNRPVLEYYEDDFIDDSEFRPRSTGKRKTSARRPSKVLSRTKRRILAESSESDKERQGGVAVGVSESPRNTRRKCKKTADLNTDSEDDDENSITKCSNRSRNKLSHRRVNSSDSDDDVPKKPRVVSGAAHSDHTPSSNEGDSDDVVFTDSKKIETPTRAASSRAKLLEERRNSDRKMRLKQLQLHRARQQGKSISDEEENEDNDSVCKEQELGSGEDTDDFIVEDDTILRDTSSDDDDDDK